MVGLALPDSVSFCLVEGKPLFLDRKKDRYFGLPMALEKAFLSLLEGGDNHGSRELSALVASGLLVVKAGNRIPSPCQIPRPDYTLLDRLPKPNAGDVVMAGASLIRTKAALAMRPWSWSLEHLSRNVLRLGKRAAEPEAIAPVTAAFDQLSLWISPLEQCVPRSLAFMVRCLAVGQAPSLVIGIKLQPFGAHCWVQYGHTVANERVEKARSFTPIWVL